MKYFLFFIALFYGAGSLHSQYYLKGQITDQKGNAVQNVIIRLHKTGYLYYSGGEGEFGISTDNIKDTLTLSHEGFNTIDVITTATNYQHFILTRETKKETHQQLFSSTKNFSAQDQVHWLKGEETYASFVENQPLTVAAFPSTRLAVHIDKASYSNIRRLINANELVPPDAVRIDELLNYFNLSYTEPVIDKTFDIKTFLTTCPWNKKNELLFINIHSALLDLSLLPQSNLVFLLDVSGSMDMPNRLPMIKAALKTLVLNLRPKDSVSIVVYGGWTGIAMEHTSGREKDKILRTIDSLQAYGDTPGASGLALAYRLSRSHFIKNGNNRVILATDGDFNVGLKTEDELESFIQNEKHSGIYLSCLGMGMGNFKDSKIQALAKAGNGNYAYLDNYAEAEKVLLYEFTQNLYAVADNVSLNVRFDSAFIYQYRIIGFDNTVGALKDASARLEGGEVGPGYSGIIVFEITAKQNKLLINQQKNQPFIIKLNFTGSDQLQKEITETPLLKCIPFDSLDQRFRFASSIILFGSMLRNSKYTAKTSWKDLIDLASGNADNNDFSQKEFISLIRKAKSIYKFKKNNKDNNF